MSADVTRVAVAYLVAWIVAVAVGTAIPATHPIPVALCADIAATIVIFGVSFAYRNSSFYDPYWSVAPIAIAFYFALRPELSTSAALSHALNPGADGAAASFREAVVLTAVVVWGCRLSWNWFRSWGGVGDEDWRYRDLHDQLPGPYWLVNFGGVHLMPTVLVFLGCLPLYAALSAPVRPFGVLDGLALLITAGAIWLETRADAELWEFKRSNPEPQEFLKSGVWSWCRHPNYLGEIGFWWGLYLFGLSANPQFYWTAIGPLSITALFWFVSLPMIEGRMLERRPAYAAYLKESSLIIPRLRG